MMAGSPSGTRRKMYPIGIQTFSEIRRDYSVYIDKTDPIYKLVHEDGKFFFLSRPRRFGKSLLVSTLQAYFEGRKELFEGLAIDGLETEWEPFSVIRFDLSTVKTRDVDMLEHLLDYLLTEQEKVYGRNPEANTPGTRFNSIIQAAHAQSGKPVVLLIDEYDAPLLNVVDDSTQLAKFHEVMREFYAPIKACDAQLRFVFLTGITKFSQLSIFSELNNLRNISMLPAYAAICGITEEELATQMSAGIESLAERRGMTHEAAASRLKSFYDGYHFADDSPDIYNPFSLLCSLSEGRFGSYWFESGTPTFLIELLQKHGWDIAGLENCTARVTSFDTPTERMATPLPMLYQGGYLTIKRYDEMRDAYVLGIPNEEVSRGLSESLVQHAAPEALETHYGFLDRFADDIRAGNMSSALEAMRSYLSSIPYHLGSRDERGFQTKFFLIFDLLGIQIKTEFKTATGRVDAVIAYDDTVYVMEFKYDKSAQVALNQIDEKGYLVPFSADGRRLFKVGVNFSAQEQTIDEWLIEEAK